VTVGATAQPVLRHEPLSEEPQDPPGLCRGVRHFNASRRPEHLLRHVGGQERAK
jgi:hypothetical protein